MKSLLFCIFLLVFANINAKDQNVLMTEVFAIALDPPMFNWTYEGRRDQFVYEASLADSPDLPSWIHYVYSDRHHSGFLYGVPPSAKKTTVPLDIVGLNKNTYESRVANVNIIIQEKRNSARYEVHMKIDNLNVADMFDVERMEALKDIFRSNLWKDAEDDLYVTFLESAVDLGARKPLNPNQGEGIVVRLGSEVMFSSVLLELQEEVRPLYKIKSCPRDFKRTSVERFFREAGFVLDWCSFKLVQKDLNNSAMHKSDGSDQKDGEYDEFVDKWIPMFNRLELPVRSYQKDLIMAIAFPMLIMSILLLFLTIILCFEHDDIILSDETVASIQEQTTPQRFLVSKNHTDTLGSFPMDREHSMSPDVLLLSRSHTNSPNSTMARGLHCRPSPPPYVRPKYKPEI